MTVGGGRSPAPRGISELWRDDEARSLAPDGFRVPRAGEIFKNPNLAATFRALAKDGKKGFYTGRIAEELIKVCSDRGGHLVLEDLENHMNLGSEPVEPISLKFNGQNASKTQSARVDGADGLGATESQGVEVWEHPPNGQGIVALIALGLIEELERTGKIPHFRRRTSTTAPNTYT